MLKALAGGNNRIHPDHPASNEPDQSTMPPTDLDDTVDEAEQVRELDDGMPGELVQSAQQEQDVMSTRFAGETPVIITLTHNSPVNE
jgi:hypothetical protein